MPTEGGEWRLLERCGSLRALLPGPPVPLETRVGIPGLFPHRGTSHAFRTQVPVGRPPPARARALSLRPCLPTFAKLQVGNEANDATVEDLASKQTYIANVVKQIKLTGGSSHV